MSARFSPDMLGSSVHQRALYLNECLATMGIYRSCLGEELRRIGYAGDVRRDAGGSALVDVAFNLVGEAT